MGFGGMSGVNASTLGAGVHTLPRRDFGLMADGGENPAAIRSGGPQKSNRARVITQMVTRLKLPFRGQTIMLGCYRG